MKTLTLNIENVEDIEYLESINYDDKIINTALTIIFIKQTICVDPIVSGKYWFVCKAQARDDAIANALMGMDEKKPTKEVYFPGMKDGGSHRIIPRSRLTHAQLRF